MYTCDKTALLWYRRSTMIHSGWKTCCLTEQIVPDYILYISFLCYIQLYNSFNITNKLVNDELISYKTKLCSVEQAT